MEHDIPFGNSNRENGTTFLDFPLFLGIFQWDEPTKRVPFTAEPEIPEILTKWKAPLLSPIFLCHKVKDGGYNNKLSPAQNTPALQAKRNSIITLSKFLDHCTHAAQCTCIIGV